MKSLVLLGLLCFSASLGRHWNRPLQRTAEALPQGITGREEGERIVGGEEAAKKEFPYIVMLWYTFLCGGTIYNDQTIVTAAHCVYGLNYTHPSDQFWVVAGQHDYRNVDHSAEQWLQVAKIIVHEHYNPSTLENDMALLLLRSKIDLSGNAAKPMQLCGSSSSLNGPAVVCGWGTTSSGGPSSPFLRDVSVEMMDNNQCAASYGSSIKPNMVCAAAPNKDSCQGDSGGPLVTGDGTLNDNKNCLAGVVSFGIGCADPMYPGVYARVPEFTRWIGQNAVGSSGTVYVGGL